jgi:hypothetical protein
MGYSMSVVRRLNNSKFSQFRLNWVWGNVPYASPVKAARATMVARETCMVKQKPSWNCDKKVAKKGPKHVGEWHVETGAASIQKA